jgi:hypothetical protein
MMPALAKVEYFGGPADGDKRVAAASPEFWSVDGSTVHRYVRGAKGMEWSGAVEGVLHSSVTLLMLAPGRDR